MTTTAAPPTTPQRTLPLLVLAATAFIYVTAETLPVGLLPEMSRDLGVGESAIGLLLTFYAFAVALVTLPLMKVVSTWDRRRVVIVTAAALALSLLVSAVAINYPMLVIARLIGAATHGVFWAVVAPVAASLAAPGKQGKAIALVYAGTSLALVAGNPLTAALGQWLGWRTATVILGVIAVAITVALARLLPAMPVHTPTSDRTPTPARRVDPILVALCLITFLAALGHFTGYTYFALIVGATLGGTGTTLSIMLFVYGLAGVAGIWIIGRTHDRWPWRSTVAVLGAVSAAVALVLAALVGGPGTGLGVVTIASIALWGMAFTTIPVCVQSAVLNSARSRGPRAVDRASAVYVVTFQVAIAAGALLGGIVVDASGVTTLLVVTLGLMVASLAVVSTMRRAFTV